MRKPIQLTREISVLCISYFIGFIFPVHVLCALMIITMSLKLFNLAYLPYNELFFFFGECFEAFAPSRRRPSKTSNASQDAQRTKACF
ncbi:hypothetical protein GUJ93_ZPchr0006g41830 [Zizania palustris]|uniref:Uncharacterized protein n=1 Tax=Zizania palustris TaxID=103762 RepID=A0A8J5S7L9_ZIZPA|nr:hypothetical protein GUJ93_ZPchr0006g41830 [Zizania palustris]